MLTLIDIIIPLLSDFTTKIIATVPRKLGLTVESNSSQKLGYTEIIAYFKFLKGMKLFVSLFDSTANLDLDTVTIK